MLFLIRLAARFNDIRQYFLKLLAIHLSSSSPNLLSAHSRPAHTFRKERGTRSEEHTSELQSHSFISYAVFCLKKKNNTTEHMQNKDYIQGMKMTNRSV